MKSKKLILLIFAVYLLCSSFSCSKDKLTKATQEGANTFSCKVDGKVFLPSKEGTSWSGAKPLLVSNSSFNGFTLMGVIFSTSLEPTQYVLIRLPYLTKPNNYTLNTSAYGEYKINYGGGPTYLTNSTYTGKVNVTRCDTVNQIYSGTFSFTAIDDNTKKTVSVTDGRFDVKRQ